MKISTIIPIKNRANLLPFTLQSIVNQTFPPHEIIIVDDNSNDDLEEAIEPFQDKIRLIRSKKPGPGAARNKGLKIATGDIIQFFDSDDLMTKNKLETQVILLEQTGVDFVYCPFVKAREVDSSESSEVSSLSTFSFQPSAHKYWHQLDAIMNYYPLPTKLPMLNYVSRGWCPIT